VAWDLLSGQGHQDGVEREAALALQGDAHRVQLARPEEQGDALAALLAERYWN
jgi:hypothetical protein